MKTSGFKRIAERYVRALFEVAEAADSVAAVEKDMAALAKALETSPEFRGFLINPLLPRKARENVMMAVLAKIHSDEVTSHFIAMLTRQKRLPLLPDIAALFIEWAATARGELKAELIAAGELSKKDVALVADRLGKAYGRKINLDMREDTSLLGGIVVKIGSTQLDASLAGEIEQVGAAFKSGIIF